MMAIQESWNGLLEDGYKWEEFKNNDGREDGAQNGGG